MLDNIVARASVGRVTDPIGRALARRGVPPDLVTALGTAGSVAASLWFLPRGELVVGVLVITVFVLLDLVDGAMARAAGGGTRFGAVLDSTCDRLADGALFAGLTWWCLRLGDQPHTAVAAMLSLVAGQVVSYLKARAEAGGLSAQGGLVERAERLILALVGAGLQGLGVPGALGVALWLLALGSVITLGQRLWSVHRSARALAATEIGPEVATEIGPDVGAQAGPEVATEIGPDVGAQAGPEVGGAVRAEPAAGAPPASPDDGTVAR